MAGIADVRTGICEYAKISAAAWPGIVTGGSVRDAEAPVHRRSLGGQDRLVGGLVVPGGTVNFLPTSPDFLNLVGGESAVNGYAFRPRATASGYPCSALTEIDPVLGIQGIAELAFADAKVNSFTLESAVGDPLAAVAEFLALSCTEGSASTPAAAVTDDHFEWYHATSLVGGVGVSLQGFSLKVENNLTPLTDMDGAASGSLRLPKRLIEGSERITLEVRSNLRISASARGAYADNLTTIAFAATFTRGTKSIAIAVSAMATAGGETPIEGEGGVLTYSYPFELADNANGLTITCTGWA